MSALTTLAIVQDHDTAADQLRHRRATLPERVELARLEDRASQAERSAAELGARRADLAGRERHLEDEVSVIEAHRAAIERKLRATSVPREAQTMAHELEGLATRQHDIEDVELELMEEAEPLDAQLAVLEAERAELQPALAAARTALAGVEASIDEQLAGVEAERATAAAAVPADLMSRYERLRSKLGGVAVAHLDGGRCTGCSLVLSRLELERLWAAPEDEIVECEQCGRMLVR